MNALGKILLAAVLAVALNDILVESLRDPRPKRTGGRRSQRPRFGSVLASGRREGRFYGRGARSEIKSPQRMDNRQVFEKDRGRNVFEWIMNKARHQARPVNDIPTTTLTGRTPNNRIKTVAGYNVTIIEEVRVDSNKPGCENPPQRQTQQSEGNENRTSNRLAFTAEEERIYCGGPNDASLREECYRFNLSADLSNETIISGAHVLLPVRDPRAHTNSEKCNQNITIVAKFPTSGQGAFSESTDEQNFTFDKPSSFIYTASLKRGATLVSRALQEDNMLVLKMTVTTENEGQQISSNFIPVIAHMPPVLILDIEPNDINSTTNPPTNTTHESPSSDVRRNKRELSSHAWWDWLSSSSLWLPSSTDLDPSSSNPSSATEERSKESLTKLSHPADSQSRIDDKCTCCKKEIKVDLQEDLGLSCIMSPRFVTVSTCEGPCTSIGSRNKEGEQENAKSEDWLTDCLSRMIHQLSSLASPFCVPSQKRSLHVKACERGICYNADIPNVLPVDCGCTVSNMQLS